MRVFPAQIDFRVDGSPPRLQYRQVAPTTIQLATGPSWAWTPWQDILIVENHGDIDHENADETHADEGHATQKNANETRET